MNRIAMAAVAALTLGQALAAEAPSPTEQFKALMQEVRSQDLNPKSAREFGDKFLAFAEKNPKETETVEALFYTIVLSRATAAEEKAVDILLKDYGKKDQTREMSRRLGSAWTPAREKFLRELAKAAPDHDAEGISQLLVLQMLKGKAELVAAKKESDGKDVASSLQSIQDTPLFDKLDRIELASVEAEGKEVAQAIQEKYADVDLPRGKVGPMASKLLKGIQALPNLMVGKAAPEAEGKTPDGKKETLADYKGKVVVLDIWATWCGPCRAMIPHEREMVKKLDGKPFALISVSADQELETLNKFLAKTEMPWNHWHNGAEGGVLEAYNVSFFPTVYVLDAKGVIRYKNVRGEELEKAVNKLLEETTK
jgi:thiol-disulfide isomerase/thioredoxin